MLTLKNLEHLSKLTEEVLGAIESSYKMSKNDSLIWKYNSQNLLDLLSQTMEMNLQYNKQDYVYKDLITLHIKFKNIIYNMDEFYKHLNKEVLEDFDYYITSLNTLENKYINKNTII